MISQIDPTEKVSSYLLEAERSKQVKNIFSEATVILENIIIYSGVFLPFTCNICQLSPVFQNDKILGCVRGDSVYVADILNTEDSANVANMQIYLTLHTQQHIRKRP